MIEVVLVDIEGTTSSLASVHKVLVPYARARLRAFVTSERDRLEVRTVLEAARALATKDALDALRGATPLTPPRTDDDAILSHLERWSDEDRKAAPLKELQGLVWERGYHEGALRSHVYPDVPTVLHEWKARGLRLAVYSSGSVHAQRLFFGHTDRGNLASLFEAHFDTAVGAKGEAASYTTIAERLGVEPSRILFLSDVRSELDAAVRAGLSTIGIVREGNASLGNHAVARSFGEIDVTDAVVAGAGTVGAKVAELARYCQGRGWCDATSGNFSARIGPDHMVLTASGRDKARVAAEDVLVADFEGRNLVPLLKPSAEAPLHAALYRGRAAVGAVAHTHSVATTVLSRRFASAGVLRIEGYEMAKALPGVVTHEHTVVLPIVPNGQDVNALARAVEERLRHEPTAPGYLVAGHGLTTWGADLAAVRRHVEALEFLLACVLAERG